MARNIFRREQVSDVATATAKTESQRKSMVKQINDTRKQAVIEEGDSDLVRGYTKSLSGGAFSTELPAKEESKKPKKRRLTPEERLSRIVEAHSVTPWDRLACASKIRQKAIDARLTAELEPKSEKKGRN